MWLKASTIGGALQEPKTISEQALVALERSLSPKHPAVATTLEKYASLLRSVGRVEEAEPMEARARAIRTESA